MSEQQPPRDPYDQQGQRRDEGRPPHPPQQQPYRQQSRQPSLTPDPQCGPPYGSPPYRGQWPTGRPGGQQAYPGPVYGYGPQLPGRRPCKRAHWVRSVLAGIGAVVFAVAVLSPISVGDTSSGAAGSAASAAEASFSSAAKPAAGDTVAAFSGSRQEDTSRFTVTAAWKPAATAQGSGDYGAWAWSEGDMPHSITSGLGDSLAQAETAAVQACEAAGGGSGGSGGCYARAWFENAYSSFAYDASGGYWGVSDASTSAQADSLALSYCGQQGGAKDCAIVMRAQTASPSPTSPNGAVIQATPSYGVWAISPSAQIAGWGVGDTIQSAQQAAAMTCEQAGGVAAECSVYGGWVENAYSAIYMGANDTWSVGTGSSPSGAAKSAQHECQTVKAVGLACTVKGSGSTEDPWVAHNLGWIDQPTTLPTQPSPTFVCVTGPDGSCLQPGAGLPQQQTWASMPANWVTSPLVAGCAFDIAATAAFVIELAPETPEVLLGFGALLGAIEFLHLLGIIVRFDEGNGNWIAGLEKAEPFSDCVELGSYVQKHEPLPQSLDSSQSVPLPQSADLLDSADLTARGPSTPNLFQPVPKSQLASLTKLPLLSQRFGYAVAQVGSVAALSQEYPAAWSRGTQKSVLCQMQSGGYRCDWRFRLNGTPHSGYVLIAVTGNSYRLEKVVELPHAAPSTTTTAMNPLWYVLIAVAAVALVIVIAAFARRRRARTTAR